MVLFYSPRLGFDGEEAGASPTGTLDETVTRLLNYSVEALSSSRRVDRVAISARQVLIVPNKGRRPILGLAVAHKNTKHSADSLVYKLPIFLTRDYRI